jgi:voltage-gated potassium channel
MLRERLYVALNGRPGDGLSRTQQCLAWTIGAAVLMAILGTEPVIQAWGAPWLDYVEIGFGLVFLIEYVLRVYAAGHDPAFAGVRGRLRYMGRPMSIVDALAIFPFLAGLLGIEAVVLRLLRVVRLLSLAKLGRYSEAMQLVLRVLRSRIHELAFAVLIAVSLMVITAAGLYVIEGETHPEFSSIPRAMWFAAANLTTVGFGDVLPMSVLGRIFSVLCSLAGVGLIALPAGILAGAFAEAFEQQRMRRKGRTEG